jgi:hypothetical protein
MAPIKLHCWLIVVDIYLPFSSAPPHSRLLGYVAVNLITEVSDEPAICILIVLQEDILLHLPPLRLKSSWIQERETQILQSGGHLPQLSSRKKYHVWVLLMIWCGGGKWLLFVGAGRVRWQGYWLDREEPWFGSLQGRRFFCAPKHPYRLLGSTCPPLQKGPASIPSSVQRPGREVGQSLIRMLRKCGSLIMACVGTAVFFKRFLLHRECL